MNKSVLTNTLPWVLTGSLATVSAMAGWNRGSTNTEKLVWASLSVLAVIIAHTLPALVKDQPKVVWVVIAPIWVSTFIVSTTQGADWFTRINSQQKTEDVTISSYDGRSVPIITAELNKATLTLPKLPEWKQKAQQDYIDNLKVELSRANRFEEKIEGEKIKGSSDPLGFILGKVFDTSADKVMFGISILTTFSLESAAIVLWFLGVSCSNKGGGDNPASSQFGSSEATIHQAKTNVSARRRQQKQVVIRESTVITDTITDSGGGDSLFNSDTSSESVSADVAETLSPTCVSLTPESERLFCWLQTTTSTREITLRRIVTSGPTLLRGRRAIAERSVSELEERNLVRVEGGVIVLTQK